jgi:uncharacterized protein (DUF2062 family)
MTITNLLVMENAVSNLMKNNVPLLKHLLFCSLHAGNVFAVTSYQHYLCKAQFSTTEKSKSIVEFKLDQTNRKSE